MKATFILIALTIAVGFVSCTTSDNEVMDHIVFDFNSVKSMHGIEETSLGGAETSSIPVVALEDMQGILETLHADSKNQKECIVSSTDKTGEKYTVSMVGNYRATTRTGSFVENFDLSVDLKFSIEKEQVYYWGTSYSYSSDLFEWMAGDLSLSNVKGESYTYEFKSTTYFYFRVADEGECLVRVPIVFEGKYDFETNKGVYAFRLSKYGK